MSATSTHHLMARYNQWMNEKIYLAASKLDDADFREDRGAFFKSVLGTLNHILVADIIWLKRFANHRESYVSLRFLHDIETPGALAEILHNEFQPLWQARQRFDAAIISWSNEISADDLKADLIYATTKGVRHADNFGTLVQHFFNHQTHHRGQITTLLSQKGIDIGSTDLLTLIRQ